MGSAPQGWERAWPLPCHIPVHKLLQQAPEIRVCGQKTCRLYSCQQLFTRVGFHASCSVLLTPDGPGQPSAAASAHGG